MWQGENAVDTERVVVGEVDPADVFDFHVQHVVRVHRDGSSPGLGVLELVVLGLYAPLGLTGLDDLTGPPG